MKTARVAVLVLSLLVANGVAHASPIDRPVVDTLGLLDDAVRARLESRLLAHSESGRATIALYVVATTAGEPIADFANRVATEWGGTPTARDVLVVLAYDDHAYRVEVGRGLEETLTDGRVAHLIDDVRPSLRAGAPMRAMWQLVDALIVATDGATEAMPEGAERPAPPASAPTDSYSFPEEAIREPSEEERLAATMSENAGWLFSVWAFLVAMFPFVEASASRGDSDASVAWRTPGLAWVMRALLALLVVGIGVCAAFQEPWVITFAYGFVGIAFSSVFGFLSSSRLASRFSVLNPRGFWWGSVRRLNEPFPRSGSPRGPGGPRRRKDDDWSASSLAASSSSSDHDSSSHSSGHDSSSSSSDSSSSSSSSDYGGGGGSFDGGGSSGNW